MKYGGGVSYSSYRGRNPRWKTALAVVLVLICLLSGLVIFMQRYLVYDENGRARLELPWGEETAPEEDVMPELHIEEPEENRVEPGRKAVLLPGEPLTPESWAQARAEADAEQLDVALTLRRDGRVYWDSGAALDSAVAVREGTAEALEAGFAQEQTVVRFGCLLDGVAAQADVEGMGLKNTGGYLFYDGNNRNWLDPAKPRTAAYLSALAVECARLGADELLLTEFSFPTVGKLNKIQYPEAGRAESLNALLKALRTALDEAGFASVALSLELSRETVLAGGDDVAGIDVAALCETVDGVYVPCTVEEIPALETALAGAAALVPELVELPETGVDTYLLTP